MIVTVVGVDLPGREFCEPDGSPVANVHVGLQVRSEPEGLVPGDADRASWTAHVRVEVDTEGALDFKGPAVHGRRGERFLYLTWGDVTDGGGFLMFRRAKLMLGDIDPELVRRAVDDDAALIATVQLTDACGAPRCARVRPPAMTWSYDGDAAVGAG